MTIEAKALLLDHAAETLDAFVPGPAVPLSQVRGAHALSPEDLAIATRDETAEAPPQRMGARGLFAATAASSDGGVPIRCSLNVGSGSRGSMPDPNAGRDRFVLTERECERVARETPPRHDRCGTVISGELQAAIWNSVRGQGIATTREAKDVRPARKTKPGAIEPPPRKLARVTDRICCSLEEASKALEKRGIVQTTHEVSLICDAIEEVVFPRLMAIGALREMVRVRGHVRADGSSAPGYWQRPRSTAAKTWDPAQRLREGKGE